MRPILNLLDFFTLLHNYLTEPSVYNNYKYLFKQQNICITLLFSDFLCVVSLLFLVHQSCFSQAAEYRVMNHT